MGEWNAHDSCEKSADLFQLLIMFSSKWKLVWNGLGTCAVHMHTHSGVDWLEIDCDDERLRGPVTLVWQRGEAKNERVRNRKGETESEQEINNTACE